MLSFETAGSERPIKMFGLIGRLRRIRDAAANWRQAVVMALADQYRPELHYMRGPGPKWRQKHAAWTDKTSRRHDHRAASP